MKKKEYKEPSLRVVMIDSSNIICTSPGASTEILPTGNPTDPDAPTPDDNGNISAESKEFGSTFTNW